MSCETDLALAVTDLGKSYRLFNRPQDRLKQGLWRRKQYYREFWALRGVTFSVKRGETVGIVGKNGSGKSSLLQIIAGTLSPTVGSVHVQGRVAALLELGTGFNTEFTGRENVYLNAAILGLSRMETEQHFEEIVGFAEIGPFIDQPVRTYSSGMVVRLAFAVQVVVPKELLIVDEVLAVGDEAFQKKCFSKLEEFRKNGGTILFVSHQSQLVVQLCDRALLLDGGELLLEGNTKKVVTAYHRLIHASPQVHDSLRQKLLESGREREPAGDEQRSPEYRPAPDVGPIPSRYDPALVPKETIRYPPSGATIEDPRLTDRDGARVNLVEAGEACVWRYRVDFQRAAEHVRFGMLIKTVSGLELGGRVSAGPGQGISMKAGEKAEVTFAFDANLGPGTYFINAGVVALTPEGESYLDRWVDAGMFRVLENKKLSGVMGPVDFSIEPQVHIHELEEPNLTQS